MKLIQKNIQFKVGTASDDSRTFWVVGSTEDIDRDGDRILSEGWHLENFKKNPVIPWAHKYDQPPVAKALTTKIQDRKLKLLIQFATAQEYAFADKIYRLYKGNFLNAFSVGFNSIRSEKVERTVGGRRIRGRDYIEQELWEVSAVTVPSNPNALTAAKQKGVINRKEHDRLQLELMIRKTAEDVIRKKIGKVVNGMIEAHNIDVNLRRRGLV